MKSLEALQRPLCIGACEASQVTLEKKRTKCVYVCMNKDSRGFMRSLYIGALRSSLSIGSLQSTRCIVAS